MAQPIREKSQILQFALPLILGPIGLMYGSPALAIALCLGALMLALGTGGFGALVLWPISIGVGFFSINRGNRRLLRHPALPESAALLTPALTPALAVLAVEPIADV
jgi:hypothetical protein